MTERRRYQWAAVAADVEVSRIAPELKSFLEKKMREDCRRPHRLKDVRSFEGVFAPAVDFAIGRLQWTTSHALRFVENSAWTDLRRHLSARLGFALTPTLRLQQSIANAAGCRENITLLETMNEFPGVLDTAARLISGWLDAQGELLIRIMRDQVDISEMFLNARQRLSVHHVRPGLSDPHDGGRTATLIEFAGRRRVIYKPRSPDREQVWFEALRWLNRNGVRVRFRAPKMLARGRYVWMEFLQVRGCDSRKALRLFYFRWGAQAALAQVLRATDLHRENWLAVGSQPILVDAELIGDAEPPSARGGKKSLNRQLLPTLLQTGLLPLSSRDRVGFYRGIAPLDPTIPKTAPPNCWPRYRRAIQKPSRYVTDLVRGFEAVAEVFATPDLARKLFRELTLQVDGDGNGRIFLRPTAQYARLLRESLEARNMISAAERWRHLARECCASAANHRVGLAEARSLLRCDVPKFSARRSVPVSRNQFSAAIAEVRNSSRLLRARVLLGTRGRRG